MTLKDVSQTGKTLRLRRKGPQWLPIALTVVVADVLLATVVWMAVYLILR